MDVVCLVIFELHYVRSRPLNRNETCVTSSVLPLAGRCRCRSADCSAAAPVGAVLGHVAQRSGAVFLRDPGPSMKKPERAVKGLGMHNRTEDTPLHRHDTRKAPASKHGVQPLLWNKQFVRACVRSVSL